MKFDPLKRELYTDKGEFIKRMHCPYKVKWSDLEASGAAVRECGNCRHSVMDTEYLSDDELLSIVGRNPDTCLKVDLNQHNIKLIANGSVEQK